MFYGGGLINFNYYGLNFIFNNYYKKFRSASLPKEYFKIRLYVCHYYKPMKIKKYELEQCPTKAYKLDQCIICLDKKPNILYKPCTHFYVCSQCDDKGKFKKCPYCRERIEETILIKS